MHLLNKREREWRDRMRGRYSGETKWYAVMVHAGFERKVSDRVMLDFADKGVDRVLLPELSGDRRVRSRNANAPVLLFPSYLFLHCRMNDDAYMVISEYREVFSILGRAYRIPTVIDDEEMQHLMGVLASVPRPYVARRMDVGRRAVVTDGLMEGLSGRILECNANFVKLETRFSFYEEDKSIVVSVPREKIRLDDADDLCWSGMVAPSHPDQAEERG